VAHQFVKPTYIYPPPCDFGLGAGN